MRFLVEEDYPQHYEDTFSALVATYTCLIWPASICTPIIHLAAANLIDGGERPFLSEHYLPELVKALKHVKVTPYEWITVNRLFLGCLAKILFAFFLQE